MGNGWLVLVKQIVKIYKAPLKELELNHQQIVLK